jgi:hypothetical protein
VSNGPLSPNEHPKAIDISKAKVHVIVSNHFQDPTYAPYCGRCRGLVRMKVVSPFLFEHSCGAIHDERQVME